MYLRRTRYFLISKNTRNITNSVPVINHVTGIPCRFIILLFFILRQTYINMFPIIWIIFCFYFIYVITYEYLQFVIHFMIISHNHEAIDDVDIIMSVYNFFYVMYFYFLAVNRTFMSLGKIKDIKSIFFSVYSLSFY